MTSMGMSIQIQALSTGMQPPRPDFMTGRGIFMEPCLLTGMPQGLRNKVTIWLFS
jgi:hypothetical protein